MNLPAIEVPGAQLPGVRGARQAVEAALASLEQAETIAHAYGAWRELKLEHASFLARCAKERQTLEQQGSFLVGAVRAAAGEVPEADAPGSGLVAPGGGAELDRFLLEAEERMRGARQALERDAAEASFHFEEAFAKVRAEVEARVSRQAEAVAPRVRMLLRPLAGGRALLQLERLSPDEAVTLAWVLTGKVPSRYGFLFDDSTEEVSLPPAPLYPEEGVAQEQTRPDAAGLRQYVERAGPVLALKGFLPVRVPRAGGEADFYRLLQRGPVMEVEFQEGPLFRNLLTREEGERLAGHLLRLKLAKKIDFELAAG